jgi:hypothetical protein
MLIFIDRYAQSHHTTKYQSIKIELVLHVFEDDVKNRRERAKGFFASALKMKQPQGVSLFCFLQANTNQSTESRT